MTQPAEPPKPSERQPVLDYETPAADRRRQWPAWTAYGCATVAFALMVLAGLGDCGAGALAALAVGVLSFAFGLASFLRGGIRFAGKPWDSPAWMWILATGFLVAFMLWVAAGVVDTGGRSMERPNRAKCASNLRQIGMALKMYANANGNQLPPSFAELLMAGNLPSAVFVCPSANDIPATGARAEQARALTTRPTEPPYVSCCSYVYCAAGLAGAKLTAHHVLAYEPTANHNRAGMNVLYGDGHVSWASQAEAQRITAELQAGHNPPR